jgi:hypothetical protein
MNPLSVLYSTLKTLYEKIDQLKSDKDPNALSLNKVMQLIPRSVLARSHIEKLSAAAPKLTNAFKSDDIIKMIKASMQLEHSSLFSLNIVCEQPSAINQGPLQNWEARKKWFEYLLLKIDFGSLPTVTSNISKSRRAKGQEKVRETAVRGKSSRSRRAASFVSLTLLQVSSSRSSFILPPGIPSGPSPKNSRTPMSGFMMV